MRQPLRDPPWQLPVRIALGAMWIVHGLEKFGIKWPRAIGGGTHSVADMLTLMADVTPIGWFGALIERLMLPLAGWLQYPVGVLEISLGLAIGTGLLLRWGAPVGAAMQTFFWLGFAALDWPLQYPLVIGLHLALVMRLSNLRPLVDRMPSWVLLAVGTAGLTLTAAALAAGWWGSWIWTYYLAAAGLLALMIRSPDGAATQINRLR